MIANARVETGLMHIGALCPRATALAVLASMLTPSFAYAQPKKPVGVLFAVGDIAECLTKQEEDALKSANPKKKAAAETHAANKTGAATAALIREEIAKEKKAAKEQHGIADLPVRVLALGDLAYDCGATKAFECFNKTWGKFEDAKILLPMPGNHEYWYKKDDVCVDSKNTKEQTKENRHAKPFFEYFKNNDFAKTEQGFSMLRFPDPNNGPWLLVGLNPYARLSPTDPTRLGELKTKLDAQTDIRCILAFSHAPLYSSGYHGHKDKKAKSAPLVESEKSMRAPFKALYEARASVLVAGHDHHYEQLGRSKDTGQPKDKGKSAVDDTLGVRSFIVGTGGTNLYSFDYAHFWTFREAYNIKGHGILKMMLYQDEYSWEFVPVGGNTASTVIVKNVTSDKCNRQL